MADLYVHAQDGADANPGTAASPKQTISAVNTFLSANPTASTVFLAGKFQLGQAILATFLTDVTVQQWDGQTQAQVRGDVPVTGWTVVSGSIFVADGPTSIPASVVWNWDENTHADGRHFGHLVPGSFASLAEGEWGYDAGSDTIRVWLPSEAGVSDPDDLTEIAWTSANTVAGIEIEGFNVLVDGLHVHLWVGAGAYCISLNGGGGKNSVNNCVCFDGGFHVIGCHADALSGHFTNCTAGGCREGAGTTFVSYGDEGPTFSGTFRNNRVLAGGLLTDTDTTVMTGGTSGPNSASYIIHTDNVIPVSDYVASDCTFIGNLQCNGFAITLRGLYNEVGDVNDGETYPVRFYDCAFLGHGRTISCQGSAVRARVALFRCRMVIDSVSLGVGSGTAHGVTVETADSKVYMECCSMVMIQGAGGNSSRQCLFIAAAQTIVAVNCSFYLENLAGSNSCTFRFSGTSGFLTLIQCVMQVSSGSEDRRLVRGDANAFFDDGSGKDIRDCWYDNFASTLYAQNSNMNTLAEWTDLIDPNGVYDVDPGFTSTSDLTPSVTSALRTTKKKVAWDTPRLGINKLPYDGTYGAYQFGTAGSGGYVAMSHFNLVTPKLI